MKTRLLIVVALIASLALPAGLFAQEGEDAEAIVEGLVEAFNAGDVEAALSLYAEDGVVDIRPHEIAPDPSLLPYTGHEGIRTWLEMEAAANTEVDVTIESIEGNTVTTVNQVSSDQLRQMGIESVEGTDTIIIEDGEIVSHTFTISEESLAQMQAAMAAAGEEQTGFSNESAAGYWALTFSAGANDAAGVGTCTIESNGDYSCSAMGSLPTGDGERMRIRTEEQGTFTVHPDGMVEVVANRANPDGSEATFHYDCVATAAETGESGLQATEFSCIQEEPADASGALSISNLYRLPDVGGGMSEPSASDPGAGDAGTINEVTITADEYTFTAPESIPAGPTRIRLENEGEELHHAQLLKLPEDRSIEDIFQALQEDPSHPPDWLSFAGGPSVTVPGDGIAATMDLAPGNYVLICVIPDSEGVPHAAHGMARPLTVTPADATSGEMPEADITMEMFDYNFTLSEPVTPGEHTFKVVNNGPQPHEVAVVQLAPGATAEDFIASVEPGAEGPPQGRPIGGLQVIDTGAEGYFSVEFEAGNDYLLICFHPDEEDGAPHFAHGMLQVFSVGE